MNITVFSIDVDNTRSGPFAERAAYSDYVDACEMWDVEPLTFHAWRTDAWHLAAD